MGLDFGAKTVGVALSDELLLTAQPYTIVRRESEKKLRRTLAALTDIAAEQDVKEIVLGLPRLLSGGEGERCEKTRAFAEQLKARTNLPVTFWDERLTTVAAEAAMEEGGLSRGDKKERVDALAAVLILQGYLDSRANEKALS